MDQTPSLRKALLGLAFLVTLIIGGYLLLNRAKEDALVLQPNQEGPLIRMEQSGGFAGTHITLVLREDGTGSLKAPDVKKKNLNLDDDQMQEIVAALDDVWPSTDRVPLNDSNCLDCFQYDVTYDGIQVLIYDPVPKKFNVSIGNLRRVVARNSSSS